MELITNIQSPEFRFRIGLQTPIPDLPNLCAQSKVWREVCESEDFWRLRFKQDFPDKWTLNNHSHKESGHSRNYKESYQYWYRISLKLRPFGYYLDDQIQLDLVNSMKEIRDFQDLSEESISEPKIDIDAVQIEQIVSYYINYNEDIIHSTKPVTNLFDHLIKHNIDQTQFISQLFKALGLDRINITLPEAIDLLFYIAGDMGDEGLRITGYHDQIISIQSSLNYNELSLLLNKFRTKYEGFPDYPSMLYAAITSFCYLDITLSEDYDILPSEFNHQRYKLVKQFDLIKIIWIYRSYYSDSPIEASPPYLFVTCYKPDVQFESWYRKVNEKNYISILNTMGIRTSDNPSYYQALARMTINHNFTWITYLSKSFVAEALGIPLDMVKAMRLFGVLSALSRMTDIIKYIKDG